MTSGKQQVHNDRGRRKMGGNGRHLQRSISCSGWTKPPSNQVTKFVALRYVEDKECVNYYLLEITNRVRKGYCGALGVARRGPKRWNAYGK
ncbi:hypothetical protein PoB_002637900 [Plakobranchus ocellatus]|uniref:Uncharacterized protein n=1 Tax=Plakobranchus ocellatus TaxID=259542 RepID=A0AAV3ZZT7_9GAST|nr:hypothetical protein PoB_002637900 [Plakobranchus ocellatus]